jgi:hypothetical protein
MVPKQDSQNRLWLTMAEGGEPDDYEFILFGVIGYICLATAWQTG